MLHTNWEIRRYTGAKYEYSYRHIAEMNEEATRLYCASLLQRYALERNKPLATEQWIARTYISVKYLLAASLMLSSAEYASARNLQIVEPYLLYYALFSCSRALVLTIPEQLWSEGAILHDLTHLKALNVVADTLRYVSREAAERYRDLCQRALATRELFSYKFPASGLTGQMTAIAPHIADVTDMCEFIAEAAQMNSECLQTSFRNLPEVGLPNDSPALRTFFEYEHKSLDILISDDEDYYRLWQFARHSNKPLSLHITARPGLVEDFFGAWTPKVKGVDQYDPDKMNWRVIFEFS